ncbi:DNA helicase [Microbacterium atlanticum]|uniref:DNA helicase n=1 Tax=Microbacterium atlanticum TaxID=2782168 RepID=UPI0018878B6C|nr:DNA helicase [Microbacterium atlanticum]
MSLSRKRKKELVKLQKQANSLWESQQLLVGEAASVAREAGRQLGNYGREQIRPQVQANYDKYAAPYVDKGKKVVNTTVIPAAGAVMGSAMSVWDAANDTRSRLAGGRGIDLKAAFRKPAPEPVKTGMGVGGWIAIVLGVAAAVGVLYAAWQTLRADDELWVADDPLRAPDA